MTVQVKPATIERFDDVAIMLGPKNPGSSVCWCLSHRLDSKTNQQLVGAARGEYVRTLCSRDVAPGVLAYDGDEVVGWAAVAPRSELPFARSTRIPHVDDLPVWSVWCIRVRPGHRGRGISHRLLDGAVAYARANGAPVVEGYPVDNKGAQVDGDEELMPTFDDVRRFGGRFPEVEEAPSYRGMPALKVRGKPFCRFWSPTEHDRDGIHGTEVLVVFCDADEKDVLISTSAGALFSTPHYEGYPALLVRLADGDAAMLAELLEDSYRSRAPKRLIQQLDNSRSA